jgi:hypothetical protein
MSLTLFVFKIIICFLKNEFIDILKYYAYICTVIVNLTLQINYWKTEKNLYILQTCVNGNVPCDKKVTLAVNIYVGLIGNLYENIALIFVGKLTQTKGT